MQQKKLTDNTLVFLTVWFLIPLATVLLIDALKLPEFLTRWINGFW